MLKIEGKTFMNIQEAVQWLLDNNALPFQSTANYIGNTEIGMGTIVNPSPAKVRIGSLIFFADSKVSTVTGLTKNGFICSNEYNNLVDDIAYVTGVAINASGHLITTLSDGQTIDAGIIKQVTGFSIDGSQHLIVSFNDGTSTDLGAIFSGNITIGGNLTVTGALTADIPLERIKDSNGNNRFAEGDIIFNGVTGLTRVYGKWSLSGTHLMFVFVARNDQIADYTQSAFSTFISCSLPDWVINKIYSMSGNTVVAKSADVFSSSNILSVKETDLFYLNKNPGTALITINLASNMKLERDDFIRIEFDLLIDNA